MSIIYWHGQAHKIQFPVKIFPIFEGPTQEQRNFFLDTRLNFPQLQEVIFLTFAYS